MADDEYNRKLESLQQYIPFLNNMITQLKDPRKKNRQQQLTKMVSLHSMITDKKKKLKLETLAKCEDVILKLYDKVKSASSHSQVTPSVRVPMQTTVVPPQPAPSTYSPITPSSPSPPRDIPKTKPVVIPTEKVVDRDSKLSQSSSNYKTKIDIYSSAADSLKSQTFQQKPSVFDRLGKKAPDMSKPPISLEDLEALQDDDDVDTERMSLNELTDLREKLQKQLSKSGEASNNSSKNLSINTTVRNTTILTKKAVEKTVPPVSEVKAKSDKSDGEKKSPSAKVALPSKSVKVIKEAASIFGSTLSSIDNKILEGVNNKHKEKERRSSNGGKEKERRNSKDEKKPESSSHKSKDKTEKKNTTTEHKSKEIEKKSSGEHKIKDKKDEKKPKSEESTRSKDDAKKIDKSKKEARDKKREDGDKSKSEKPKDDKEKIKSKEEISDKKDDKSKSKTEGDKSKTTPENGQTFKRLADKYNPRPRKPTSETTPEVPPKVSESIENSMKTPPASIPFLDNTPSPVKQSLPPPSTPLTVPLLSPTSSTNSIESEIAACNKKPSYPTQPIPSHVSNILANPNATAIINNVVNQFKGRQTPVLIPPNQNNMIPPAQSLLSPPQNNMMIPPQNNFPPAPPPPPHNQGNYSNNYPPPNEMHYNNHPHQGGMMQSGNYWGNQVNQMPNMGPQQNYAQRSFTPIPNQYDTPMQQMDYYPPNNTPVPNHYNNHQPPLLSPQYDNFDGPAPPPPPHQRHDRLHNDGLFGAKDQDMRYREDWRRSEWPRDTNRDPRSVNRDANRDPRLHRDPRSYRDDQRMYRRDSREFERDPRPKFRDPRLSRYPPSNNRYDHEQTPMRSRSRSVSRDSDESNNTFASPLDSLYSTGDGYRKTGKGYGVQHYKIPKIKKENETEQEKGETEPEPEIKQTEPEPEPKPQTTTNIETKESPKVDENVASANVSSSTECDNKQTKEAENAEVKESTEVEISSTNDIQEGESRDESKNPETNPTDIINRFLKKLLENESTRAAASVFIDNVSNSLDDEKLKMVVQTVKAAKTEEENQEKSSVVKRKKSKLKILASKKKQAVMKRKLRLRQKRKIAKVARRIKDDDEEEEEEVAEEEKKKEEVIVSVGERTKSRKRLASTSEPKKKKTRHKTELDMLHEDIQDMFIRDGVLTATGKRMCRLLKNDAESSKATTSTPQPPPPQIETRTRRAKIAAEKFDSKASGNSDKLKVMSNVRVLLPKISVDKLPEIDEEGQRYSLRRLNKNTKSYAEEDSDDEKNKSKKETSDEEIEEEKEAEQKEEKEKLPPPQATSSPRKIIHRKRTKTWASGIIPKRKKKEPMPEQEKTDEADKSLDLIEPDKNYFSSKPWSFKTPCKLCSFDGKNITQHYRTKHPDSEILSSRLSPTKAEEAIKESMELKLDEIEEVRLLSTRKFFFKCRFCGLDMNSKPSNFYDHVSTHTGEYRHLCTICSFGACNLKPVRVHYMKVHGRERDNKSQWIKTKIYGYICLECNFVQMNKKTVENHVNIYHLGEGKKILKINLSTVDPLPGGGGESSEEKSTPLNESVPSEDRIEEEEEEPQSKKKKVEEEIETVPTVTEEPEAEKKKTDEKTNEETPPVVIKKEKEIDMTVFTCNTDIQEENEKIEQERLKKMTELNETVKTSRQSLNFIEQLSNRLLQEQKEPEPVVTVKSEPMEPEPEQMFETSSKKPSKTIEPPSSSSVEVVQKDNVKILGMIQKLQGILKEEKSTSEEPPPLAPLVEKPKDDKSVLSAGFLNITKDGDGFEYGCRVPSCLFASKDRDRFVNHWNEDHTRINQSYKMTKCRLCQMEISATLEKTLLSNFFAHVEEEHLEIQRNVLRTRRLSGDKLSTTKTEPIEEKEDSDIMKIDDNPFPFKISGVMSLAEDPIPPLSPIREKASPKFESVVLKEIKLNSTEKTVTWKCAEAIKKFLQCPRELYKCPQFFCKFATNWRHLFESHVKAHASVNDESVACVYCDVKTPLTNAGLHIDLRHSNCLYSCSQCLYRALTREYVMVHMKTKHKDSDLIISLPPKTPRTIMMSKQKKYTVKEACQPYKCGYKGCDREFLYQSEYTTHLQNGHTGLMFCGYKAKQFQCLYKCVIVENMIDHWRTHNCYNFHCLICKIGCMELYSMLEHYSMNHPNMEPIVVDRRSTDVDYGYSDEAFAKIKYLNEELLDSVNTQQFTIVSSDNTTAQESPTKSESKNVTLLPLSIIGPSNPDNKIIAIIPKTMEITKPVITQPSFVFASITPNDDAEKSKEIDETPKIDGGQNDDANTDPLSIDGEIGGIGDESDPQELNESTGMKNFGLIGYQLYRCAFCDISFSNARDFKTHCMHSKQCRDENNTVKPFKCVHCERLFKNPHGLLEHIQYHGQLRFCCSLCNRKCPSSFSLKLHMRIKHNVTNTITTPLFPNKNNIERDEFVLRPVPVAEPEISKEIQSLPDSTMYKKVFAPSEIDILPKRYIFNSDIKCALCSYSTKVRTNLVRHLQFHSSERSVPDIAPVNPVPCLDKNEKMFDKMTNLAISSFTGGGRMGQGPKIKIETKVEKEDVEVPAYVPSNRRYVCCASGCNYLCPEEANLRHHLYALHEQEKSFTCAHCKLHLKTDIEGFLKHLKLHDLHLYKCANCTFVHNLKHKVDKHSTDKHPDGAKRTITIRALEAEILEIDHAQNNAPGNETPPASNIKWTKPWHCGMCKYRCAAKNDIVGHIFNKHDINTQFKCTLCSYKTNEKHTFDDHFKENHPDHAIDIIHVYYKSEGGGGGTATQKQFDTTPLWQRDRPRIRHIRGILFEETSPQKVKKVTKSTPSTSTFTSNLDLAIEAVATGTDDATKTMDIKPTVPLTEPVEDSVIVIDDDEEEMVNQSMEIEEETDLFIDVEGADNMEIKPETEQGLLSEEILIAKYGKMCSPIAKAFRCPICYKFRTKKISFFIYHLLKELKCHRFKCNSCDYACVTFDTMVSHCQDDHNSNITDNVTDTPIDKTIEYWLQLLLKYQSKAIVNQTGPIQNGDETQSPNCKTQCEYCQRWFRNIHMLKEHELYHWAEHGYTCDHCCGEFVTLNELFQHTFITHPKYECSLTSNGPYVSKIIATLKSPVINEGTSNNDDTDYVCGCCHESEKSVNLLKRHFDECHKNGGEEFHYKIVTKSKLEVMYCCTYCHKRGNEDLLKKHHDEEHKNCKFSIYQYICLECSGTFLNIKDLRGHFNKTHSGKKLTYSCVENKQIDSSKDQYCCVRCPFRSASVGGIRSHIRKHLRPIDCLLCGATFIYPTEARAHHNKEHLHNKESVEENKDRLKEYEDIVQQIVASKERGEIPKFIRPSPPRRMLARKSTGAPFVREYSYYGNKKEQVDMKNITTSIEVNNVTTKITAEQFSNIFNIFPVVEVRDCEGS